MDVVSLQQEEEETTSENAEPTTNIISSTIVHIEQAAPSPVIDEREEVTQLNQAQPNDQSSWHSNNVENEHNVEENHHTTIVVPETRVNKRPVSSAKFSHLSVQNDHLHHQQQQQQQQQQVHNSNARLYLTHVNLTLESIRQRPLSSNAWRAHNIKKNLNTLNNNYNNQTTHINSGSNKLLHRSSFSLAPSPDLFYDAKYQNNRPKSCKLCTHLSASTQNNHREESSEQNVIRDSHKDRSNSPVQQQQQQQQQLNNYTQQFHTMGSSVVSRAQSCKLGKRSKPYSDSSEASHWQSSYSTKSYQVDRSKSSMESTLDTQRANGRHTYSVGAFNKFKNNLLRSRNYSKPHTKTYFYNQNGNQALRNNLNNLNENFRKSLNITADKVTKTMLPKRPVTSTIYHNLHSRDAKTTRPYSQIKSIYEIIQRDHNHTQPAISNTDLRRSNYFQTLNTTQHFLASSLLIKKLEQN